MRPLTGTGHTDPALSATLHVRLAALAEAIHASACHLSQNQLRHLDQFIALQRWRP